ncbi:MAG: laccase domain-containing protein, partial [Treponemataceae bacterium]|nr:laccase domain-containing protein [Treponemataceae bacterium]
KTFGSVPADICVILGPHIHECCYTVDAERAAYFRRDFSSDCCTPVDGVASGASCSSLEGGSGAVGATGGILAATKPSALGGVPVASVVSGTGKYRLSLARANEVSLEKSGIKPENILHCTDCTSCFSLPTLGVAPKNALVASEARACDLQSRDKNAAGNAAIAKAGNTVTDGAGNSADAATAHVAKYFPYGSFRRQTAHLPEGTPLEERFKIFSAMAAVIGYLSQRK